MAIQLECPGCKATLSVDESLAGKQGKCIYCGQRVVVPGRDGAAAEPITLIDATPEQMMRVLSARRQSAVLFLFTPTPDGSYELGDMADEELKCIVTDDVNAERFGLVVQGIGKRFSPRPNAGAAASSSNTPFLYELKGDRLGMSFEEFKRKYGRGEEGAPERLPICSNEAWGANKAALHSEPWHAPAGIIHARIDHPAENNPPTIGGVKTQLLLYHFLDGQLFRISAFFPTDLFHLVRRAAMEKYGDPNFETQQPRQVVWQNPVSAVFLTRGTVHPPEPSTLVLVFKPLAQIAESRRPQGAGDI